MLTSCLSRSIALLGGAGHTEVLSSLPRHRVRCLLSCGVRRRRSNKKAVTTALGRTLRGNGGQCMSNGFRFVVYDDNGLDYTYTKPFVNRTTFIFTWGLRGAKSHRRPDGYEPTALLLSYPAIVCWRKHRSFTLYTAYLAPTRLKTGFSLWATLQSCTPILMRVGAPFPFWGFSCHVVPPRLNQHG